MEAGKNWAASPGSWEGRRGRDWRRPLTGLHFLCPEVKLKRMAGKGRGLVAGKDLKAGTLIAVEEALGAAVIPAKGFCDLCAGPVEDEDYMNSYCSTACETEARETWEWAVTDADETDVGPAGGLYRLTLQLYLSTPEELRHLWATHQKGPRLGLRGQRSFHKLLNDDVDYVRLTASLPNHAWENSTVKHCLDNSVEKIVSRCPWLDKDSVGRELKNVQLVVYSNTFNLYRKGEGEEWEGGVGSGLYPAMSLLNHSCIPNCVRTYEGTRMVMRLVRDAPKGTELSTTYGCDVKSQGTSERRAHLTNWEFRCLCTEACGDIQWRRKEAAWWGFACPQSSCSGALTALGSLRKDVKDNVMMAKNKTEPESPANLTRRYLEAEDSEAREKILGELEKLRLVCAQCNNPADVPVSIQKRLLRAAGIVRKLHRVEDDEDLLKLVKNLHPQNQYRLKLIWVHHLRRGHEAGSLDGAALSALMGVMENLSEYLLSPLELDVAKEARAGATSLEPFLDQDPYAAALKEQLDGLVHRIHRNHYGPLPIP